MNRSFPRNLIIISSILAMVLVSIPASAQPSKVPAFKVPTSWLGAVLSLVDKLPVPHSRQAQADRGTQEKRGITLEVDGPVMRANTGVCIDPDGNRVPCPGV